MEVLKSWILAVTGIAMLSAAAVGICPDGPVKKIVKLICGLLMILVILKPVTGLFGDETFPDLEQYRIQAQQSVEESEWKTQGVLEDIIEEETAAYIVDKAACLGADCRAQVWCRVDGEGMTLPDRVEISGSLTDDQRQKLTEQIETELGIPAENQSYLGGNDE